ncbi:hypothetical protein V8E53_011128, partial [Lactarius tabidus]
PVNRLVSTIADKPRVNAQEYGRRLYGLGFLAQLLSAWTTPVRVSRQAVRFAVSIGARSQSAKIFLENDFEHCRLELEHLIRHGVAPSSRDTPVGRGALERHYRHRYRHSGGVLPDRPLTERSSASASSFCFRPGSVRFGVGFSTRSAISRRRSDLCFAARVERGDR